MRCEGREASWGSIERCEGTGLDESLDLLGWRWLAPEPNFQLGSGVWTWWNVDEAGKGGREASTFLKSGWGLRLILASKLAEFWAAIFVVVVVVLGGDGGLLLLFGGSGREEEKRRRVGGVVGRRGELYLAANKRRGADSC